MNINEKIEGLMKDLQENIENPRDLEYINKKLAKTILEILTQIDERTSDVERKIEKMENELFISDDDGEYFEIVCPYCNYSFEVELEELKDEVFCPECNNGIELDWSDGDCHGDCSCCHGDCSEDEEDNSK